MRLTDAPFVHKPFMKPRAGARLTWWDISRRRAVAEPTRRSLLRGQRGFGLTESTTGPAPPSKVWPARWQTPAKDLSHPATPNAQNTKSSMA